MKNKIKYFLNPLIYPRKFHAFCLGTPKSGTHSIAEIFDPCYRACHEPEFNNLWSTLFSYQDGCLNDEDMLYFVKARDRRLWLELDSSNLNYFLMEFLLQAFPKAKFILTIRDCFSFVDSAANHRLNRFRPSNWLRMDQLRYGCESFEYSKEEEILKQNSLPSLEAYFSQWAEQNRKVISTIPKSRLLIVRTDEISSKIREIADFLEIHNESLNSDNSHAFRANEKYSILSEIDKDFVDEIFCKHCKFLMDEFFPDKIMQNKCC